MVVLAVGLLIAVRVWQDRQQPAPPESLAEGDYVVARVVDGDTLLLENDARVRLIGVDAPESVKPDHPVEPFGPEASAFARELVGNAGNTVRLQFDKERVDQYGRFLAFVWVGEQLLNEELIRAGFAHAEMGFRYSSSMKTRLRRAEEEAKHAGRGIWTMGGG
ncbi:MAG: thermonuclease family protein [Rhodopirellula sp.]|nr:thermonuclease family protein [Rhodopirellula sp.]